MRLTAAIIVGAITYIVAELLKPIKSFDKTYIPYVNFGIGVISSIIVIVFHIGDMNMLESIVYCILASMGAGGTYEFVKVNKKKGK